MIRRNVSGQHVIIGPLIATGSGSPVTSGASVQVGKDGGSLASGGGTLTHLTDGVYRYSLTQSETDCAQVHVVLTASGAIACCLTVLTTSANPQDSAAFGLGRLDAAVSSRSTLTAADVWSHATRTLTSFGTLASDVASAVWSAGARTLTSFGTLASDVWSAATRTLTSYADSAGVTTLLSRLTSQRATNLDNLDATVSSRLASSAYQSPPSAGTVADAVWDEPLSGHQAAGSAGEALQTAGSGGIPPATQQLIEDTAAIVQTLQAAPLEHAPAVVVGTVLSVARGYDYTASSGRSLALSSDDWPHLAGATVALVERDPARTLVHSMEVVLASPVGAQTVRCQMAASFTSALQPGRRPLRVYAELPGGETVDLADVELVVR